MRIFYEDKDLIAVEKPPGMDAQSVHSFAPDMVSEIRKHIHMLSTGGGEPYVGVIHRLDKPVGGVMVYAKNPKAAAALSRQVQNHELRKIYAAVVCGKPVDNSGIFVDYLLKDPRENKSRIVDKGITGAKRAELRYRTVQTRLLEGEEVTLVQVELVSGRHHQIRVQFAGHGLPLWGDGRYHPAFGLGKRRGTLALWACGLAFRHPVSGELLEFFSAPEGSIFPEFADAPLHKTLESGAY